jgi:secretion/DNA translocation related TadE-like protein
VNGRSVVFFGERRRTGEPRTPPGQVSAQRGSVTLVAAAMMVMALTFAVGLADVARVLLAAARAQTAADASALAAAQELAVPTGRDPSEVAREYAGDNGAELVDCRCSVGSSDAVVTARIEVGPLLLFADDRSVDARARAIVMQPRQP